MSSKPGQKAAWVREAFDALGPDVKYAQLRDHVRKLHNVEIAESSFYAERSRRLAAATQGQAAKPTTTATPTPPNIADVIQTVRRLIQACGGKEQLKEIIDAV